MKIITLLENTPGLSGLEYEHGLSFWIETEKHCLLVDTGASDMTARNADALGLDLSRVDTVILSHGHYDHTGGLTAFLQRNDHARVYLRRTAFYDYFNEKPEGVKYIGMDKKLRNCSRLVFTDGDLRLDGELSLFTHVTERCLWPRGNLQLKRRVGEDYVNDCFDHEQYAVIQAEGKTLLAGGCAHAGIVNILNRFRELYGSSPDYVLSGFHMMKAEPFGPEETRLVLETADALLKENTVYFTGHCTGPEAFSLMKERMGDRLRPLHSGEAFTL